MLPSWCPWVFGELGPSLLKQTNELLKGHQEFFWKSGTTFWIWSKLDTVVPDHNRELLSPLEVRKNVIPFDDTAKKLFLAKNHKYSHLAQLCRQPVEQGQLDHQQIWY